MITEGFEVSLYFVFFLNGAHIIISEVFTAFSNNDHAVLTKDFVFLSYFR